MREERWCYGSGRNLPLVVATGVTGEGMVRRGPSQGRGGKGPEPPKKITRNSTS